MSTFYFVSVIIIFSMFFLLFVLQGRELEKERKRRGKTALINEIPNGSYKILFKKFDVFLLYENSTNTHWSVYGSFLSEEIEEEYTIKIKDGEINIIPPFA